MPRRVKLKHPHDYPETLANCLANAHRSNASTIHALAKAMDDATNSESRHEIMAAIGACRVLSTTLGNLSEDYPQRTPRRVRKS